MTENTQKLAQKLRELFGEVKNRVDESDKELKDLIKVLTYLHQQADLLFSCLYHLERNFNNKSVSSDKHQIKYINESFFSESTQTIFALANRIIDILMNFYTSKATKFSLETLIEHHNNILSVLQERNEKFIEHLYNIKSKKHVGIVLKPLLYEKYIYPRSDICTKVGDTIRPKNSSFNQNFAPDMYIFYYLSKRLPKEFTVSDVEEMYDGFKTSYREVFSEYYNLKVKNEEYQEILKFPEEKYVKESSVYTELRKCVRALMIEFKSLMPKLLEETNDVVQKLNETKQRLARICPLITYDSSDLEQTIEEYIQKRTEHKKLSMFKDLVEKNNLIKYSNVDQIFFDKEKEVLDSVSNGSLSKEDAYGQLKDLYKEYQQIIQNTIKKYDDYTDEAMKRLSSEIKSKDYNDLEERDVHKLRAEYDAMKKDTTELIESINSSIKDSLKTSIEPGTSVDPALFDCSDLLFQTFDTRATEKFYQSKLESKERIIKEKKDKLDELNAKVDKLENDISNCQKYIEENKDKVKSTNSRDYASLTLCPVCRFHKFDTILSTCGHCFCYDCLQQELKNRRRKCPQCGISFYENNIKSIKF